MVSAPTLPADFALGRAVPDPLMDAGCLLGPVEEGDLAGDPVAVCGSL